MYERDRQKYFVVDGHVHFWDASPQNWVAGQEQFAKAWIDCFHAYQGLGPTETHWSVEHVQKYSEQDLMKDVIEDGYVDVAICQPTYLTEWSTEGFVEGLLDWDYPSEEFSDYPRVTTASKQKILGLNAAKLYGIEVPTECQLDAGAGTPAAQHSAAGVSGVGAAA